MNPLNLPPRDPNAMDMSAVVRKATSDKEKEEYRKTGRCFECGKQGHLARGCPNKVSKARATSDSASVTSDATSQISSITGASLAELALQLSEEEQEAFAKKMEVSLGSETSDFPNA